MKAKQLIVLTLLAILLLSTFGCGGGAEEEATPTPTPTLTPTPTVTPTATPPAGYLPYTDETNGFSISYPEDWDIMPEELWEEALIAFWAPVAVDGGVFTPSFNVSSFELPGAWSLETLWEGEKRSLRGLRGYNSISTEQLMINDVPAMKHVWKVAMAALVEGVTGDVQVMQTFLVQGKTEWVITAITTATTFDEYEYIFDTVAGSLQLLE